jgi:hypothetical protein
MRISVFAIVSAFALSVSAAAFAADAQTATAQPVSAVPDSQKIVCHNMIHQGMLIQKTQCRTQYAWDKERRLQEDMLADMQLRSLQFSGHR